MSLKDSATADSPRSSQKGKRILVVEDDDAQRRLTCLTYKLKFRHHETRDAASGEAALEAAKTFQPNLLLIDLGLPDMTGHQLVKLCKQLPELADAKFFALSGRGEPADLRRSAEAGFDRHIVKPPDFDQIEVWMHE